MERLVAQFVLAVLVTNVIPVDAANLEWQAGIPVPEDAFGVPLYTFPTHATLPMSGDRVLPPIKTKLDSYGVVTTAQSVIAMDAKSGSVLFEKQADEVRPIGSITKLMTALVFLESNPDLSEWVTVRQADFVGGGRVYLNYDDGLRVRDVLGASIVGSDNTATSALQRLSGLTEEAFIAAMNAKAQSLGMTHAHFVDVAGIGSENVTTARELFLLLAEAKTYDVLQALMTTSSYSVVHESGLAVTIDSTDMLLESFLNQGLYEITGGKTGFIPEAGYCFVTSVMKGDGEVFVAVLGAPSKNDRFADAKALAAWAFATFTWPNL
ncbi:MAG: Peptidase S11 D-alanyl-D-alanine carboxypeptidase 1 [Candidatus Uhrbacteria bacterium GW2011_GWD2_52_7]|uniref:Peptidase S11 D-alanyl-D-alanine carboxypeptidase 1 n=1 Tax=Candidatus Uhrbacteria bacterium GW2011_GWD2_52_7 TaxID=1618989 RepID=A0A0G1XEZ5_9BACT|nr:MAG: Peptidase S11 D-alanyl-D-alanine carboxypeptidase 1 [Candidatus Uhrbacteria bacterium GW2011_GWD2_52_7]